MSTEYRGTMALQKLKPVRAAHELQYTAAGREVYYGVVFLNDGKRKKENDKRIGKKRSSA